MEDFVTFEIAKKLKEKGFKQGFNTFGCQFVFSDENTIKYVSDIGGYETKYFGINVPCPTISQVLKWLREEKKIDVLPQRGHISIDKNSKVTRYYNVNIYFERSFACTLDNDEQDYSTYEQAALAGIEYVLDNLI